MIEVIANDRLGKKVRVKVDSDDTVETLKVPPNATPLFFQDGDPVWMAWTLTDVENDRSTDRHRLAQDSP